MRPMKRSPSHGLAIGLILAGVCIAPSAMAQKRPFPQGTGYGIGFLPKTVGAADAKASYDAWKAKYLKSDCGAGTARVEFESPMGSTVSEGQGYGMLLTAYFGDREAFDALWKFVGMKTWKHGLMGWKVTCPGYASGEGGEGSAPDGDEDIGMGLVVANDQWGEPYGSLAKNYLTTMQKVDFETCPQTGRNLPKRGNWDGGCSYNPNEGKNSSYFTPAFYRAFQTLSGDKFWGKAADDVEDVWIANRDPNTGLIANEVDQFGKTHGEGVVDYNGCRISWRAVTDYLWYGTPKAKDVADKLTAFASKVGISKIVDGYKLDGTPSPAAKWPQLNAWVGSWAAGAMAQSQETVDAFAADFRGIDKDNGTYYGASLRTLYLLTLTGNMWKPGTPAATTPPPLPSPAPVPLPPAPQPGPVPTKGSGAGSGAGSCAGCAVVPAGGPGVPTTVALGAFVFVAIRRRRGPVRLRRTPSA